MIRSEQLQDAVEHCETRMKIAERNLRQCDRANERLLRKLRGDYSRASDDLAWLQKRRDEAFKTGSAAFRRDSP